jgi:uncharacterized protein YodC (DUF2158 family)
MSNSTVKSVNYIVTASGAISLWIVRDDADNTVKQFSIATDHPNYKEIINRLKTSSYKGLEAVCDIALPEREAKKTFADLVNSTSGPLVGKAQIRGEQVFVNDVPVHNVVTSRIVDFVKKGLPVEPVLRFLELVLQNPDSKSQEELYDFLSNRALPLTEDGCFLGYKRVREDYKDIYSGTIDNIIGTFVSVPREEVDPDRRNQCSYGLHVGALDYVRQYGSRGHVLVVKVNPQDCVSVPQDYNHMKLRTCRYEILFELPSDSSELKDPCYTTNGEAFANVGDYCDEQDCECDDFEEEDESCNMDEDFWKIGWEKSKEVATPSVPKELSRAELLAKYRLTESSPELAPHDYCKSSQDWKLAEREDGLFCIEVANPTGWSASLIKSLNDLNAEIAAEVAIKLQQAVKTATSAPQAEIAVGDVVELISGGPAMTCAGRTQASVFCQWFSGTEFKSEWLPVNSLKLRKDVSAPTPIVEDDLEENDDDWQSSSSCEWNDSGC